MNTTDIIQEFESKMVVDGMAKTRGYVMPGVIAQYDESCVCVIARKETRKETAIEYAKECGRRLKMLDSSARVFIESTWLGVINTSTCTVVGSVQHMCMLTVPETENTLLVYSVAGPIEQDVISMFNAMLKAIKEEKL